MTPSKAALEKLNKAIHDWIEDPKAGQVQSHHILVTHYPTIRALIQAEIARGEHGASLLDLSKAELWAVIGCINGVHADEREPQLISANDKMFNAYNEG